MNKLIQTVVVFALLSKLAIAENIIPQPIHMGDAPQSLSDKFSTFISILNGKSDEEMSVILKPTKATLPRIVAPSDFAKNTRRDLDAKSLLEVKKLYKVNDKLMIMVYGIIDIEGATTSSWIKSDGIWYLEDYGMDMRSLLMKLNSNPEKYLSPIPKEGLK